MQLLREANFITKHKDASNASNYNLKGNLQLTHSCNPSKNGCGGGIVFPSPKDSHRSTLEMQVNLKLNVAKQKPSISSLVFQSLLFT